MPKFAANLTLLFNELPFMARFGAARQAGFDAVEFLFPYAEPVEAIAAALAEHRLKLVLHNLPAGDWAAGERGIACDPARVDEFRDSVARALRYALPLGVPALHCMAGIVGPDLPVALARETYISNLKYAAQQLQPHGLRLLIEPINTFDIPAYFLTGSAQAAAIITDCGAANIGLQFDMYHLQRMEGRLAATLRAHLPLIGHMQLADTPGRHEPGTGEIDYRSLFALIDALGYRGHIGCEYIPQGDTVAGLGWRSTLCAGAA